jgi:anti-sigma factor RsiW
MKSYWACRKFRKLRLREGGPDTAGFCAEHLRRCQKCREFDEQVRRADAVLNSSLDSFSSSPQFTDQVVETIRKARSSPLAPWKPALIAATTAALAMGTFLQILTSEPKAVQSRAIGSAERSGQQPNILFTAPKTTPEKSSKKSG